MSILTVSSKGQVVLPAKLRARLGLGAGARLLVTEEAQGLRLSIVRPVIPTKVAALAGMVKARSKGKPRSLASFDPATLLDKRRTAK
jgi:AbrB family looped-hinge helix DNA binding protein